MNQQDKPRILVVDDRQDNLDLICEVFENEPYQIVTAGDAEAALERAREKPLDVAILDVQMPDVDGYELCQKICALTQNRKTSIVFLTAERTSGADAVHGLLIGGCDYVTKPFEGRELRARIHAILRMRREHEQDTEAAKKVTRRLLGR